MTLRYLLRGIASWWFTTALLLGLFAPYLYLSFGRNPYPAWSAFVFRSAPGIALCLALIVNLLAASIRIILQRTGHRAVTPERIRSMDLHESIPVPDDQARTVVSGWLRERITHRDIGEGGIRHVTGRSSFLPGSLFRLGIIITLSALMISVQGRETSETVLHEGEQRDLAGAALTVTAVRANLPGDFLQVGEENLFRLEGVQASLTVSGSSQDVTPGFPRRIAGRYYRIVHLGYSQVLTVTGPGVRTEQRADLDLLPPGRTAIVPLFSGAEFLTFTLEPERTITKGLLKGKQYDLTSPRYRVVAQKGGSRVRPEEVVVGPGGSAQLGGLRLSLGVQTPYLRVQIVDDPALPWLYAGIVITLAGMLSMLSRFFWYERELAAMMQGGVLLIGYREEFFRKWGMDRFQRWLDRLPVPDLP